jgi:hypothetical protein
MVAGGDGTPGLGAIWDDQVPVTSTAATPSLPRIGARSSTPARRDRPAQAAAGGKFAIGGAITTLGPRPASSVSGFWDQLLFTFSGAIS